MEAVATYPLSRKAEATDCTAKGGDVDREAAGALKLGMELVEGRLGRIEDLVDKQRCSRLVHDEIGRRRCALALVVLDVAGIAEEHPHRPHPLCGDVQWASRKAFGRLGEALAVPPYGEDRAPAQIRWTCLAHGELRCEEISEQSEYGGGRGGGVGGSHLLDRGAGMRSSRESSEEVRALEVTRAEGDATR